MIYRWAEKGGSSTSSIRLDSAQSIEQSALTNINITSKASLNLRSVGSSLNLQSGTSLSLNAGGNIKHTSAGGTGIVAIDIVDGVKDPIVPLNDADSAKTAGKAEAVTSLKITDHMVRPEHEGWTRDEDENSCKTPRNKNYQG